MFVCLCVGFERPGQLVGEREGEGMGWELGAKAPSGVSSQQGRMRHTLDPLLPLPPPILNPHGSCMGMAPALLCSLPSMHSTPPLSAFSRHPWGAFSLRCSRWSTVGEGGNGASGLALASTSP